MTAFTSTAVFAGDRKNDLNPHGRSPAKPTPSRIRPRWVVHLRPVRRKWWHLPWAGAGAVRCATPEAGLFFRQAAVAMGLADAVGSTFDDAWTQLARNRFPTPDQVVAASGRAFLQPPDGVIDE